MSVVVAVWLVGAVVGSLYSTLVTLMDADIDGASPRETLSKLRRRLVAAVFWPIALPAYFYTAYQEDRW